MTTVNDWAMRYTAAIRASNAHLGQVDKIGKPYMEHVERVARMVEAAGGSATQIAAAWLHDVVEDTGVTLEEVQGWGTRREVLAIVDALTRRPDEPLHEYCNRILKCPGARLVKLCDTYDNLDPRRLVQLPNETRQRLLLKYGRTLQELSG